MATILVTGGAGYIGSAASHELIARGYDVIIVDNMSKGKQELIAKQARFYKADLIDTEKLKRVFKENDIDAVLHFAAYKAVGESMKDAITYSDNITGSRNLLDEMVRHNVNKIIFSSTAAVYGDGSDEPITESHPVAPKSYYGETKRIVERMIEWYSTIHGLKYTILRYFNVAGDAGLDYIDPNAENIFPIIAETIQGARDEMTVFGDDYDTVDGSGVRDYIDINDLIEAHIRALDSDTSSILNLGTGKGYSVLQLIKAFENVSEKTVPYRIGGRREGDPAFVVSSYEKAKERLGWEPERTIEQTVKETLRAYQSRSS
ncbi:MAG: UDP-glucose 4-epimerase GalE [Nanoarchaeota archaeon]